MMLIGYNPRHKAMMDMVTVVVHQVEVISEVVVMLVFLEEDGVRLFAITIVRQDM